MKLAHYELANPIVFKENTVEVLVIENERFLRKIVTDLVNQSNGIGGDFVLSDDLDNYDMRRYADIIIDLFNIDFSNKKYTAKINQEMIETASGFQQETKEIIEKINNLAAKMITKTHYEVNFNQIESIENIIKLLNFYIDSSDLSFAEQIAEYMRIMSFMFGIKLFVFVNLKCFLSKDELESFYKTAFFEKINVLLIESRNNFSLQEENTRIIDKDLCEI